MKSVLVTGGTVRLGRAIAEYLRDRGYKVITTSSRTDSRADIIVDFRNPLGAAKCYAEALMLLEGDPPDAVVNNAALFTGTDPDLESVNLTAPKKLTMLMAGRETPGRGCVVNILDATQSKSIASALASGRCADATGDCPQRDATGDCPQRMAKYEETKRELRKYTKISAAMFSETLRVNAVSPGPIDGLSPVGVHEKAGVCPLGRPKAIDVAKAVAFLLENESVTGVDIPVDGGLGAIEL